MSSDRMLGLVLDRSGSMASVWDDAAGSFKEFVEDWAERDPSLMVVLTTFNHGVDVREPRKVSEVELDVTPEGYTALYDATVMTIRRLEEHVGDGDSDVVVAIITDGLENYSKEHKSAGEVFALVSEKQDEGWTILYLGASNSEWRRRDLHQAGIDMGVNAQFTQTVTKDRGGYAQAYAATTSALVGDDPGDDEE